jgi:hypothetical protein
MPLPAIVGILGRVLGAAGGSATNLAVGFQGLKVAAPVGGPNPGAVGGAVRGLSSIGFAAQGVTGGLSLVTGTMNKLAGAAGAVTAPLQVGVGLLGSFRNSVTGLGAAVSEFTALANPALTQKFAHAAEDLTAVIGKGLMPVLTFATQYTRGFADVIQAVSGPMSNLLNSALKPLGALIPELTNTIGGPLTQTFKFLSDALAPNIRAFSTLAATFVKLAAFPIEVGLNLLASSFEVLMGPLTLAAQGLDFLAKAIDGFVTRALGDTRKLLGIPTTKIAGGSVGAAVKPATISSVEDYQKKAFMQAFSLGTAASGSPEERSAGHLGEIAKLITNMPERIWTFIQRLPPEIIAGLRDVMPDLSKLPGVPSLPGAASAAADTAGAALAGVSPAAAAALVAMRRLEDKTDARKGEMMAGAFGLSGLLFGR